jgi:hypothetical protein
MKDGKVHFLYLAQTQPPREHYVRYDLKTAKRDRDVSPEFKGETISLRGLDGFFATVASRQGSPLYCVSRDAASSRIACLMSLDNGESWHDHAVSDRIANPYAIGGAREVAGDGSVIGSFTDQVGPEGSPGGAKVYFFRIPGRS